MFKARPLKRVGRPSGFINDFEARYVGGRRWRLLVGLWYYSEQLGRTIVAPGGFVTDLASVPRVFWWLFPPSGPYLRAAALHDFLYLSGLFTRRRSDDIFLEAMAADGVNVATRAALWCGVRLGGWVAWSKYRSRALVGAEAE